MAGFMLTSNSFSKQIFLAVFGRQPQSQRVTFPYLPAARDRASHSYPVICECLLLLFWFCFLPLLFFPLLCVCVLIFQDKNREKTSQPSQAMWPSQAKAKSEVSVNHSCWGCPLWERSSGRGKKKRDGKSQDYYTDCSFTTAL